MIKLVSLMKRKEGMSFEDFKTWATEEHFAFAKEIPGLKHYTVNVLQQENNDLPYDSVNEMWFESEEARVAAFGSDAGKAAGGDAAAHTSNRVHLVTEEKSFF